MEIKVGQIWERKEVGTYGEKYFEVIKVAGSIIYMLIRNSNWEILSRESGTKYGLEEAFTPSSHYKCGDILVNMHGNERKILGICGEVYFMSYENNFNKTASGQTKQELDDMGFKLKSSPSKLELSMNEIAEKFGIDVGSLKIKKD